LPFQGAKDRLSRDLLPPRACLLIAHDEVLIVYSGEMKVQHAPIYRRLPHQTGVTERSISRDNRRASHHVLRHMMISHQANRISDRFAVVRDAQHHVFVVDK
jgi:hypothetical protein